MEGHETSDWNSYYADTQEVSGPAKRGTAEGERGGGGGAGWEGGLRQKGGQSLGAVSFSPHILVVRIGRFQHYSWPQRQEETHLNFQ